MRLTFEKKRLVNANLTCVFPANPNAVLDYGRFMSMLPKQVGGRVVSLSVPQEAPLEIPRLSVVSENVEFMLSLDRLALVVTNNAQGPQQTATRADVSKNLASFLEVFESFQNDQGVQFQFSGLIGTVQIEQPKNLDLAEIQAELYRSLTKVPNTDRRIVNFSWQMGQLHESGNLFINFGVKTYQTRNVSVNKEMLKEGHNFINLDAFPVDEQGLEVTIDINNRPKKEKGSLREEVLSLQQNFEDEMKSLSFRLFNL